MTTTLLLDGSTAPDPRHQRPSTARRVGAGTRPAAGRAAAGAKLTFGGLLRSERIKLSSLRSVRFTLAATLVAGLGLSGLFSMLWVSENMAAGSGAAGQVQYLLMASSISVPFIALVFGVLGVIVMSSEYASGLILSTLVAAPRRGAVFAAKAIALAAFAAVTAVIVVVGSLLLAAAIDPASAAQLWTTQIATSALGLVAYLTLLALFAFGVATLTRNAAAGIGVVAGVTFVAPIAFSILSMTGWDWVPTVAAYLPPNLGNVLSMGVIPAAGDAIAATGELGYGAALAAMVAWAAVTVIPAAAVFKRRDAR